MSDVTPGPRDPQAGQDHAEWLGWAEAQGYDPGDGYTEFDSRDMRDAFTAGMQAARDLAVATLAAEVRAGHVRIETGPPAALRALRGLIGVQQPQPAPGHVLVMRGTIALRDAEIELLREQLARTREEAGAVRRKLDIASTALCRLTTAAYPAEARVTASQALDAMDRVSVRDVAAPEKP